MSPVHDPANGLHRLVRRDTLPWISKGHLYIGGFAVEALRGGLRHVIAPEILHMLHMCRIGLQLANQVIVVAVGVLAEWLLPLHDNHGHHAGVRLVEQLAHSLRCLK
ncbi:Uncharacterised protein [Mycobacteroides abscessus]|nr:Uncharacterised protein [Mycobacteroides abscessus]SLE52632.1 Uncharacterised protein [Mycobacteroides abscessus subsp. massiliense]